MAEGLDTVRVQLEKSSLEVAQTQLGVIKDFKTSVDKNFTITQNGFKSIGKGFNLSGLQTKITSIFSGATKAFTSPFKKLSSSVGNAFSSIKSGFAKLNPFSGLKDKIKDKVANTKNKIQKIMGRDIDSLKQKFYSGWAKPKKIIKQIVEGIKKSKQNINRLASNFFNSWRKPKDIAKIFAKTFQKFNTKGAVDRSKENKGGGGNGTMGTVLGAISKTIIKIGSAIVRLLNPVSIGIAIALGVTPPILLLIAGLYFFGNMMLDKAKEFIPKMIDSLCAGIKAMFDNLPSIFGSLIKSIIDCIFEIPKQIYLKIKGLFSGLGGKLIKGIGGAVAGVGNAVGSFVGGVKDKLFGNKDDKDKNKEQVSDNPLSVLSNSLDNIDKNITTFYSSFEQVKGLITEDIELKKGFIANISKLAGSMFTSTLSAAANKVGNIGTGIKSFFSPNEKQDPFAILTETFKTQHNESIQILREIKDSIIEIKKSKINISNNEELGMATATDGNNLNNVNVSVNTKTNLSEIVAAINSIGAKLDSIINNTAQAPTTSEPNSFWKI